MNEKYWSVYLSIYYNVSTLQVSNKTLCNMKLKSCCFGGRFKDRDPSEARYKNTSSSP